MYTCIHIYIYTCIHTHTYIYTCTRLSWELIYIVHAYIHTVKKCIRTKAQSYTHSSDWVRMRCTCDSYTLSYILNETSCMHTQGCQRMLIACIHPYYVSIYMSHTCMHTFHKPNTFSSQLVGLVSSPVQMLHIDCLGTRFTKILYIKQSGIHVVSVWFHVSF